MSQGEDEGVKALAQQIGAKVRLLRSEAHHGKGMLQEELSRRSGYSVSYVSMIERGERSPSLETLGAIAAVFGLTPSEFFAGTFMRHDAGELPGRSLQEFITARGLSHEDVQRLEAVARIMFSGPRPAPGGA